MRLPAKLVLIAFTLAALLWPTRAESPVEAVAKGTTSDVRIQHDLIHVVEAGALPRQAAPKANRLTSLKKPVQTARTQRFVVRAGRLLMGNGRYRPEPFPRPEQQGR